MVWNFHFVTLKIVVPVHAEQVARVGSVLVNTSSAACRNAMWFSKFTKRGKDDFLFSEATHTVFE